MVTLGTILITSCLFLMIIVIDMILYKVSFFPAIYLLFTTHMSMGKIYLLFATLFMFATAIIIDIRRLKGQILKKESNQCKDH